MAKQEENEAAVKEVSIVVLKPQLVLLALKADKADETP